MNDYEKEEYHALLGLREGTLTRLFESVNFFLLGIAGCGNSMDLR